MGMNEVLTLMISFGMLIAFIMSDIQKLKCPFSNEQTGTLRNEIKETRRNFVESMLTYRSGEV